MSEGRTSYLSSTHWGSFRATVEGGKVVDLRPFEGDRNPSPILRSIAPALDHELRVGEPWVREGYLDPATRGDTSLRGRDRFVRVSWDTALALVASELGRVKESYGNEAIFAGSYGWSSAGRFHHAQSQLHRFCNAIGGYTGYVNTYSFAAGEVVLPHIVGGDGLDVIRNLTVWPAIVKNTRLIVAFGGLPLKNAQVHAGGIGDHGVKYWLERCAEAGIEIVNIGPIREDCADFLGAEWIAPRPNTDTAIMLGLAHTLLVENLHDQAFLDRCASGFDVFRDYLFGKTDGVIKDADFAARISGLDAETIRHLARRMAATRCLVTMSFALQRADHGEQPCWAIIALAAMLGQIGLPGGGFGIGYGSLGGYGNQRNAFPSPTVPQGNNATGRFIPVARISDLLLNPGGEVDYDGQRLVYPDIKLVYWAGGNPFHHHQDINRLLEAWRRPQTIVVNEIHWNSLARHADIVLPATTTLERNDIGASSWDRFLFAMPQIIPPVRSSRNDFDIFRELADRMGHGYGFDGGNDEMQWLRVMYAESAGRAAEQVPSFEEFWERGYIDLKQPERDGVLFEGFRDDPVDKPLSTPSGMIELFSPTVAAFGYDDCPGHPAWLEPFEWLGSPKAERHPLHLVSSQPEGRLHSQLDFGPESTDRKIAGREPVWINPEDARSRGIANGDVVRVFNDRGSCLGGAWVTDGIRAGVARMATGAWFDPLAPGEKNALDKHGNPNMVTRDKGTSRLAQGPAAQTALVEIELFDGPVPPVTVFTPPKG